MAPVLSLWGLIGLMACKGDTIDLKESADTIDTASDTADTGATGDDTGATGDDTGPPDTGAPDRAPEAGCTVQKMSRYANTPRHDDRVGAL